VSTLGFEKKIRQGSGGVFVGRGRVCLGMRAQVGRRCDTQDRVVQLGLESGAAAGG
jgi:hypothetical protein